MDAIASLDGKYQRHNVIDFLSYFSESFLSFLLEVNIFDLERYFFLMQF